MIPNYGTEKVKVVTSPVFELLASMYRLQNHEKLEAVRDARPQNESADDSYQHDLNHWVDKTRSTLSDFIKKELEVFFHYESFIGLTMVSFAWAQGCSHSIEAFIALLKRTPAERIYASFMQTGYTPEEAVDPDNAKAVIQYIKNSNLPEVEKWKLNYLYADLEETKSRIIKLVTLCYEHYFAQEDVPWLEEQTRSAKTVQALVDTGGKGALTDLFSYFKGNEELIDSAESIVLCPSYFYHKASLASETGQPGSLLYVYGIRHIRTSEEAAVDENRIFDSFKILADEKRIRIIKHLSKGSLYGYELAQKLELSNSTISHHLSVLSSIGIVSSTRIENKVYFKVNKDELEKLMQQLTKALIHL